MSWRDSLQQGRFRGVDFLIDSHGASGGRRLALHEYPLRDLPYAEDIGRKAREFSIECYVLGADYMAARDRLIEALEAEGTGALVHPYLGSRRVAVRDYRLTESTRDGGLARFSITFVESGERAEPNSRLNTASIVDSRADDAIAAVESDFASVFSTAGQPEFVRTASTGTLGDVLSAIEAAGEAVPGVPSELTSFQSDLSGVSNGLTGLIQSPADLGQRVTGLIGSLSGIASRPGSALRMYRGLFDHGDDALAVPRTTPARIQQADNQDAAHSLVRRAAVVEAVRASAGMQFESADDALAVRDELADRIDAEAETADDASYVALTDLRAAMVADINARGAQLARISRWTPKSTLPALVVAHKLYGDAERATEVVDRNAIRHPGFVPGGDELEVLNA